jgi:hypothetical protein
MERVRRLLSQPRVLPRRSVLSRKGLDPGLRYEMREELLGSIRLVLLVCTQTINYCVKFSARRGLVGVRTDERELVSKPRRLHCREPLLPVRSTGNNPVERLAEVVGSALREP